MRFHWQNLNENHEAKRLGSGFLAGRAWLDIGLKLCLSWYFLKKAQFLLARVTFFSEENDLSIAIGIPWLFYLVGGIRLLPWRFRPKWAYSALYGRDIGVSIHDAAIWISFFEDDLAGSEYHKPWYRRHHWSIHPIDILFGRSKYSERDIEEVPIQLCLPEGSYPGTAKVFESTWKRSRWPWPRRMVRTDLKLNPAPPVPGKGENSWDCGEDAIHGMVCPDPTVEKAMGFLLTEVLKTRERYGGRNWKPSGKSHGRKA